MNPSTAVLKANAAVAIFQGLEFSRPAVVALASLTVVVMTRFLFVRVERRPVEGIVSIFRQVTDLTGADGP